MTNDYTYKDYVANKSFYDEYSKYQKKYAFNARESDKTIIGLVADEAERRGLAEPRVLDIGCSTGNLLHHLQKRLPKARLTGGDLMAYVVDECRENPLLQGMAFEVMDICALPKAGQDMVVANAILFLFDWDLYDAAVQSLFDSLAAGGMFVGYEWMHDFHSDITVIEKSNLHPDGLRISMRPYWRVRESFLRAGFADVEFRPFHIPIDLPRLEGREQELVSRTVATDDGQRLLFRGPLHQPWCHMTARKP